VEPTTLVMTALLAGAMAGVSGTASTAVQDAYQALIAAVRRRIGDHDRAPTPILEAYAHDPVAHYGRLAELLADPDPELAATATRLFQLTHPRPASKYAVAVVDSRGVQVGDGNQQTNMFS